MSSQRDKEDVSSKERSRMDKSVKRREKESPARGAPAKKKRARILSSSSSSGSDVVTISSSDVLFLSSSSEDKDIAEVKLIDKEEEKQLRTLGEQREKHRKRYRALKEAVRVHGSENLLQRAKAYSAAQRPAREGAETAKTKQQERKAETELSRADQAATERGRKERSTERPARRRTEEGERV